MAKKINDLAYHTETLSLLVIKTIVVLEMLLRTGTRKAALVRVVDSMVMQQVIVSPLIIEIPSASISRKWGMMWRPAGFDKVLQQPLLINQLLKMVVIRTMCRVPETKIQPWLWTMVKSVLPLWNEAHMASYWLSKIMPKKSSTIFLAPQLRKSATKLFFKDSYRRKTKLRIMEETKERTIRRSYLNRWGCMMETKG